MLISMYSKLPDISCIAFIMFVPDETVTNLLWPKSFPILLLKIKWINEIFQIEN